MAVQTLFFYFYIALPYSLTGAENMNSRLIWYLTALTFGKKTMGPLDQLLLTTCHVSQLAELSRGVLLVAFTSTHHLHHLLFLGFLNNLSVILSHMSNAQSGWRCLTCTLCFCDRSTTARRPTMESTTGYSSSTATVSWVCEYATDLESEVEVCKKKKGWKCFL